MPLTTEARPTAGPGPIATPRRRPGALAALAVGAVVAACGGDPAGPPLGDGPPVRIVTFGDSNTDGAWSGTNPEVLARAYVSKMPFRLSATDPHHPGHLAGKIEGGWKAARSNPITVVNHAIGGTTTGGGGFGGPDRHESGSPNSRTVVQGTTRFEAEVLGRGGTGWHGGEPVNERYPDGPIPRVNGFVPGPEDFVYVAMGTNDPASGLSVAQTLDNLRWMVETWIAAGQPAAHFLLATLPPTVPPHGSLVPSINGGIRALAAETGVSIVDLAAHTSDDDGLTWRAPGYHVGDELHYSEQVRDWIAAEVFARMNERIPGPASSRMLARR